MSSAAVASRGSNSRRAARLLWRPWSAPVVATRIGPFRRQSSSSDHHRLLVIGSGVAGSATALCAAELYQIPVTIIYAGHVPTDCNSYWAQGGIIYRNYQNDSAALLAADITRAGAGWCDPSAVHQVATHGPSRVRQLLLSRDPAFCQVPFARHDNELALCLEASHSAARILYQGDYTGRVISEHLAAAVARHPLIRQQPHTVVTDLMVQPADNDWRCVGVRTLDRTSGQLSSLFGSQGVVLASGGLAGIYEHSTNPPGFNALGSSVALALRAQEQYGLNMTRDLEFVQFHPTALFRAGEPRFLLSEALRGEGAVLRDGNGRRFATDYHVDGELAPRDVVARAVYAENRKAAGSNAVVTLDITHRDKAWLHQRFPSIQAHLQQRHWCLSRNALPVTPAAHYTCGGVTTDLQGRTPLPGLYAAGEAARTGLHGANRLASTSLLEGLVFGGAIADYLGSEAGQAARHCGQEAVQQATTTTASTTSSSYRHLTPTHINTTAHWSLELLRRLRRVMWNDVGVLRTSAGLQSATQALQELRAEICHLYAVSPTLETAAVRDAAYAGEAVAQQALNNPVSAGAHYLDDSGSADRAVDEESARDEDEPATAMGAP
jgi:L-aspartate oxidase